MYAIQFDSLFYRDAACMPRASMNKAQMPAPVQRQLTLLRRAVIPLF
jgi:hypothetical protein